MPDFARRVLHRGGERGTVVVQQHLRQRTAAAAAGAFAAEAGLQGGGLEVGGVRRRPVRGCRGGSRGRSIRRTGSSRPVSSPARGRACPSGPCGPSIRPPARHVRRRCPRRRRRGCRRCGRPEGTGEGVRWRALAPSPQPPPARGGGVLAILPLPSREGVGGRGPEPRLIPAAPPRASPSASGWRSACSPPRCPPRTSAARSACRAPSRCRARPRAAGPARAPSRSSR